MRWIPVVLWTLLIYLLSTEHFSFAQTASLLPAHSAFLLRKLAHWTAYFILAMLLAVALSPSGCKAVAKRHVFLSIAIAVLCALTDEWHQSFVPSRFARISDVAIDTFGAVCGSCSSLLFRKRPE